jgi:hypothetical protein
MKMSSSKKCNKKLHLSLDDGLKWTNGYIGTFTFFSNHDLM